MLEELAPLSLSGGWDDALLEPVAELNVRLLERLQLRARQCTAAPVGRALGEPAETWHASPLLSLLAEEWRALDSLAQRRLAHCPYLLLDAGFAQPERWQSVAPAVEDACASQGYFEGTEGIALVRRALLFAWHLARSNRVGARVLLGMSARAAERIADCRLQDLDALAERRPVWIVPRWEREPAVWRQLMAAARRGVPAQLRQAQLRGLQLIAAGCT